MKVTIKKGESLYEALQKLHIALDRPCGGRGTCGLCTVEVARFGRVKACQFKMAGIYDVVIPACRELHIVDVNAEHFGDEEAELGWDDTPMLAVDIGTTTVAWRMFFKGNEYAGGFVNPQRQYGADVMSRIQQAREGRLDDLREVLVGQLKKELAGVMKDIVDAQQCKMPVEVWHVAIAANTTMLHLLNGWSCDGLGSAPFRPISLQARQLEYQCGGKRANVTELPGITAFVGADIVSGMYAVSLLAEEKPVLLLDLGTNGEMALAKNGKLFVTSAAGGPAFEASEAALKIHASGVLRALHQMLRNGAMDTTGLLSDEYFESGYRFEGAIITQELVRDLQMAKGAIRAGVEILLKEAAVAASEVDKIYLAGGMGYFVDAADAIAVGLLPEEFAGKVYAVGNLALAGARRFLKRVYGKTHLSDEQERRKAEELKRMSIAATEILLSEYPGFDEIFVKYISFPDGIHVE